MNEVDLLHNDTESGAAAIADKSLSVLQKECVLIGRELNQFTLQRAVQLLLDTHPMASIENALYPIFVILARSIKSTDFESKDPIKIIENIFSTHRKFIKKQEKNTIETLFTLLKDRKSILTFSHSSTVNTAFIKLAKNGYCDKEIYILESRPLQEGERTALLFSKEGFKHIHLGIDFAVKEFVKKAELALFGADTIFPDGWIVNKIGSATIAEIFYSGSKEVIVAASPSKISIRSIMNIDMKPNIPYRDPKDITPIRDQNITVWNKYFESVNPKLISALIMDLDIISSPLSEKFSRIIQKYKIPSLIKDINELWLNTDDER
jgi:translation initiation factor 2B subunit (eIF-2B alpha/beta/delta family)